MASRYAHAKQFKRMKKMNNKLKSRLGRVKRDIERQLPNYSVDIQVELFRQFFYNGKFSGIFRD